ncbi:MAG TPA: helix-hairpin-helix domain-containing protein, partial [Thermoanaerobaculia bacterium]
MRSRARAILGTGLVLFLLLPAVLASAAEKGTSAKVDINSASQSELESLPGVGPALAKRIIENRPYSSASGLSKAGVPEGTIDKLRGLVKAGRGSKAEAKEEKIAAKSEKKAQAEKSSATKAERKAPESAPTGKVD